MVVVLIRHVFVLKVIIFSHAASDTPAYYNHLIMHPCGSVLTKMKHLHAHSHTHMPTETQTNIVLNLNFYLAC